jgi:signal transduction histidine kinase
MNRDRFAGIEQAARRAVNLPGPPAAAGAQDVGGGTREEFLGERLIELEHMATVGRLALGMAHDIANLLNIITMHATRSADFTAERDGRRPIDDIAEAANRSAELIRRLIALGRGQDEPRGRVDLGEVVQRLEGTIAALLGPTTRLAISFPATRLPVACDRLAIEQALMNLCLNASEAMGRRGRVEVRCEVVAWPGGPVTIGTPLRPGQYASLVVEDEGPGVEPAEAIRLFAPFYSTKLRGSGLGLAVVASATLAAGGVVVVGRGAAGGARFCLLFPLAT